MSQTVTVGQHCSNPRLTNTSPERSRAVGRRVHLEDEDLSAAHLLWQEEDEEWEEERTEKWFHVGTGDCDMCTFLDRHTSPLLSLLKKNQKQTQEVNSTRGAGPLTPLPQESHNSKLLCSSENCT